MVLKHESVVDRLASEAIRRGADALEVEYKGGCEEVFAVKNGIGHGIARFPSSSPEAVSLRNEPHRLARRMRRMTVGGCEYEAAGPVYESFGEDAFRLELRRV